MSEVNRKIEKNKKDNNGWFVSGAFESYAVADGHDGVINGIRMAGHVKTCREWDQLFILRMGIFTWYKLIQCLYYYTCTLLHPRPLSL